MDVPHLHCLSCFFSECSVQECPLTYCSKCYIKLHECKLQDHEENICLEASVPCLLFQYGCKSEIARKSMGSHLKSCPASVVRCNFTWSRQFLSLEAKRLFKKIHRGLANFDETQKAPENYIELRLALLDQQVLFRSLNCKREARVRQRDFMNPQHPMLPLRYTVIKDGSESKENDSSDEEEDARLRKLHAKRKIFAGCLQCKIDPSAQHLHTLGNVNTEYEISSNDNRNRFYTNSVLPPFHHDYGLFLSLETDKAPPKTLPNEMRKLVYFFSCDRDIRRDEVNDHILYHQTLRGCDNHYIWCPFNCGFGVCLSQKGELRMAERQDNVVFISKGSSSMPERDYNLNLVLNVIASTVPFLDSGQLNALSCTCKSLRNFLFHNFFDRSMVYPIWEKSIQDGKMSWRINSFKCAFSNVQTDLRRYYKADSGVLNSRLEDHVTQCTFKSDVNIPSGVKNSVLLSEMKQLPPLAEYLKPINFNE
ncbi:unnamed protein product [Bursaphelenchus xylophilus]|uniref:(pine wood nematode) hypothetical protein n=1 Tax=Bursaphelenchus xylophilus TaxID=6326 RepID=A0A1I7SDD5_BURXY|nr:unnamed protein product [Bursaphelenchus xylophilus]CAG9130617.1 unnamed protein product [Bursaphelenchus xylophilus]